MNSVWIFHGAGAQFAGGVFTTVEQAEQWIGRHRLTGVLTLYPVDQGVFDWALAKGIFSPRDESHTSAKFIGGFTSASMEHYHYEDGRRA